MKYSNAIQFLVFFSYHYLFAFEYHGALFELIEDRFIIFDGKIGSLKLLLEDHPKITQMDKFVSKFPNTAYTALKCKYADYIVDLLQTLFSVIDYGIQAMSSEIDQVWTIWISTGIEKLIIAKPYVETMIFNLFYYLEKKPELRTSDQNLLKSLLSLNIFLYHSKTVQYIDNSPIRNKTKGNLTFLNKCIIQIINGMELFRCKNCLVLDPYKNFDTNYTPVKKDTENVIKYNTEHMSSVLSSTLDLIYKITDIKIEKNYTIFIDNMYDPEFILLKNLLDPKASVLGRAFIEHDGEKFTLQVIYEAVKAKYNINDILEFQKLLINIILDLCYRQIHFSLEHLKKDSLYHNIKEMIDSFELFFMKILQIHCLIDNFSEIVETKLLLKEFLEDNEKVNDKRALRFLLKKFESLFNHKFHNSDDQQKIYDDKSLISFINSITDNYLFKSFIQVINLISYEPYSNNKFYIDSISDYKQKTDVTTNDLFLKYIDDFRYALFAFMSLIKTTYLDKEFTNVIHRSNKIFDGQSSANANPKSTDVHVVNYINTDESNGDKMDSIYLSITHNFSTLIVHYFRIFVKKMEIKYILLPLMIRLQYSVKLKNKFDLFEVSMLFQMLFITNSLLENYVLRKYKLPTYNLDLFNFYNMNTDSTEPAFKDIKKFLAQNVENPVIGSYLNDLNDIYNENMHNTFLSESDNQIKFKWNASPKTVFEVSRELSEEIFNLYDLIGYQRFVVKFFVAKILIEINLLLKVVDDCNKHSIQFIENSSNNIILVELDKLRKLELPKFIRPFLDYTIKLTYDIFNSKNSLIFNTESYVQANGYINNNLKLIGVHSFTMSNQRTFDFHTFQNTIELFDQLLNKYSEESKEVFFLNDISPVTMYLNIENENFVIDNKVI